MRVALLLLVLAVLAPNALAQINVPTFSESVDYEPRAWPTKKKKKDKSSEGDKKDAKGSEAGSTPMTSTPRPKELSIEVSVFSNTGSIVSGLSAPNFKVFIDGQERGVSSVETASSPINFIFLLDASPSGDMRIKEIQEYAKDLIERLGPNDRAMVIAFNEKLKVLAELTGDKQVLAKAIEKMKMAPGTSIYDALGELFEKRLPTISGRTAIVLVTDGVDTTSKKFGYESSLLAAERAGVPVFPVYFDTYANLPVLGSRLPPGLAAILPQLSAQNAAARQQERYIGQVYLNDLIHLSGGRAVAPNDANAVRKRISSEIPEELRSRYVIKLEAPEPVPSRRRKIRVRVDRPNVLVLARASYFDGLTTSAK
jgi:VWFA-related protein